MDRMNEFVDNYLDKSQKIKILDVGAYDVNGTFRNCFNSDNWQYFGADLEAGPNVDIVLKDKYSWPVESEDFDVVISGQTLEHVQNTHAWITEVARVLKPGGIVCIIAPWIWKPHRHPVDCWRILPDGMFFLLDEIAKLKVLKILLKKADCVGIAKKCDK